MPNSSRNKILDKIGELEKQLPKARQSDEEDANSGSMYRIGGHAKSIQNQIKELRDLL
jgi:hypothetical protein